MKFCSKCGKALDDNARVCFNCGNEFPQYKNTSIPGRSGAALSYIGPLCLIFLLTDSPALTKFHAKQGFNLLIAEMFTALFAIIIGALLRLIPVFGNILAVLLYVLLSAVILLMIFGGIRKSIRAEYSPLPIIGELRLWRA